MSLADLPSATLAVRGRYDATRARLVQTAGQWEQLAELVQLRAQSPGLGEKKIDRIADRLVNIERLLESQSQPAPDGSVRNDLARLGSLPTPATLPSYAPSVTSNQSHDEEIDIADASNETHSLAATRVVENAVQSNSLTYGDQELRNVLDTLKKMVTTGDNVQGPMSLLGDQSIEFEPRLAPLDESTLLRLVDYVEGSLTLCFSPGLTVPVLKARCLDVLHGEADAARRLYVYSTLWHLCHEKCDEVEGEALQELRSISGTCVREMDLAIRDLGMLLPPSHEATCALITAADVAINLCRPRLAQALSSQAALMVRTLAYHDLATMRSDSESVRQGKILLFWMVYWLDTSCAFRFARSPVICENDISVPHLSHGSIIPPSFVNAFEYSIRLSGFQCRIIDELYSYQGQRQKNTDRSQRIGGLQEQLREIWDRRQNATSLPEQHKTRSQMDLLMKQSDAVMYYSTLALLQHGIPSHRNNDCSPALQASRQALHLHAEARVKYKHLPDVIWIVLKAPLTPFVLVFCHIISRPTTSAKDQDLLSKFVESLRSLSHFSEGMMKMYQLCDMFCKVAVLYVRAKDRAGAVERGELSSNTTTGTPMDWIGQVSTSDIDDYLASIGFAPVAVDGLGTGDGTDGGGDDLDTAAYMDWYQGNSSLMGFLEQDLTNLQASASQ
ncbi:hypothetical protein CAC42_6214 [Sphaceloma murrayae]|uniref:Transcription factor domain-containing protein n=1 Tax=Sphaceloma murrayae TaxID=2082308 RepID=A0A2K1QTK3_9PEZI|nr:hypothetical protein CAC42_6214 [Sphaceloma murrayae]